MAAAVLGRLPGTTVYRNVIQYPDAYIYHGMIILRIDSPIYFANINFIKDRIGCESLSYKQGFHQRGDMTLGAFIFSSLKCPR
jgi:MFS superfamily sulfate permease-like transporter